MSKNANRFAIPAREQREFARADYQEAGDEFVPSLFPWLFRYVDAEGLALLIDKGEKVFFEETGFNPFPHNLSRGAGRVALGLHTRGGCKLPREEGDRMVTLAARMGGWLAAAGKFPGLVKLCMKGFSPRGVNSDYTYFDLPALVSKFPSPGNLERRLWATKCAAEKILRAYEGQKPSWVHCGQALMAEGRPAKSALIAAALTLGWDGGHKTRYDAQYPYRYMGVASAARGSGAACCAYRQARAWLVEHRLVGRVLDTSDGVRTWVLPTPALQKAGVTVLDGIEQSSYGKRKAMWLVRFGERTYHIDKKGWVATPLDAMKVALTEWRRREKLEKEEADLVGFLQGELGFSPLVVREDSYWAGNCFTGTESWIRQRGWARRRFIPGPWLIPHLDESLVRNVVAGLYRRHSEQLAA